MNPWQESGVGELEAPARPSATQLLDQFAKRLVQWRRIVANLIENKRLMSASDVTITGPLTHLTIVLFRAWQAHVRDDPDFNETNPVEHRALKSLHEDIINLRRTRDARVALRDAYRCLMDATGHKHDQALERSVEQYVDW